MNVMTEHSPAQLEQRFEWNVEGTVQEARPERVALVSEGICPCTVSFHSHPFVYHEPPAPCLSRLAPVDGWGYCDQCLCYWRVSNEARS